MNWLDIILILWLCSSVLSGLKAGFVYKLGTLIGLIAGLWLASRWTPTVSQWFGSGLVATISAFFFLLSLISKLFGLFAWTIDKFFSIVRIIPFVTTVNRVLGAFLSVAVTAFFLSASLYVLDVLAFGGSLTETINNSLVAQGLLKLSIFYKPLISERLTEFVPL